MFFLREMHGRRRSVRGACCARLVALGLASTGLVAGFAPGAAAQTTVQAPSKEEKAAYQPPGDKSLEQKLQAVERERDELKRRIAALEQSLKQLQSTVDNQVHDALGDQPSSRGFAFPPSTGLMPRRALGPYLTSFRPMFPPFGGTPDPVELAVAYSDALGERAAAKPALDGARQKIQAGHGATAFDVEAASARSVSADRKVRLLRTIITTARAVAADEADRMRRLGAAHAVSVSEVRNADARLKIFDEILATDSESPPKPLDSPRPAEPK